MPTPNPLQQLYPWTTTPFLANAPMGGYANHALPTAVTKASALGFLGSTNSMTALEAELASTAEQLPRTADDRLPIGVGFIVFAAKLHEALDLVAMYRPAAVWLFAAPADSDYKIWAEAVRQAVPGTHIWIQTGGVAAAVSLARECEPDVLVLQGSDAGGHGKEKGCGIVSLVPEAIDALEAAGWKGSVVAAGGIVDGRGVAAALALGADGVVMGTRFLAAPETTMPSPTHTQLLLTQTDGGQSTVRAKVFDELRGPNIWPVEYDGRAIVSESFRDWKGGVGIEEVRKRTAEAEKEGRGAERAAVWAGSGVGLVTKVQGAGDIVEQVRGEAVAVLERLKGL